MIKMGKLIKVRKITVRLATPIFIKRFEDLNVRVALKGKRLNNNSLILVE